MMATDIGDVMTRYVVEFDAVGDDADQIMDQAVADGKIRLIRVVYSDNTKSESLVDDWRRLSKAAREFVELKKC